MSDVIEDEVKEDDVATFDVEEGADLESTDLIHDANTKDTENMVSADSDNADEVEQYSKKVQKRIAKLTYERGEAERREQAAMQYAQGLQAEHEALKQQMQSQVNNKDEALFGQYSQTIESKLSIAKENYKKAHESGDADALIEAQSDLARLSVEKENLVRVGNKRKRAAEQQQQYQQQHQQQQQQHQYQQQQQVQQEPDPAATEWAERNDWFGQDQAMTYAAFGIHRGLLEKGLDPNTELYYNTLDEELSKAFPNKLGNPNIDSSNQSPNQQSVVGANRPNKSTKKRVKLTQSEIVMANKLGVPLKQYAKYKTA